MYFTFILSMVSNKSIWHIYRTLIVTAILDLEIMVIEKVTLHSRELPNWSFIQFRIIPKIPIFLLFFFCGDECYYSTVDATNRFKSLLIGRFSFIYLSLLICSLLSRTSTGFLYNPLYIFNVFKDYCSFFVRSLYNTVISSFNYYILYLVNTMVVLNYSYIYIYLYVYIFQPLPHGVAPLCSFWNMTAK